MGQIWLFLRYPPIQLTSMKKRGASHSVENTDRHGGGDVQTQVQREAETVDLRLYKPKDLKERHRLPLGASRENQPCT